MDIFQNLWFTSNNIISEDHEENDLIAYDHEHNEMFKSFIKY